MSVLVYFEVFRAEPEEIKKSLILFAPVVGFIVVKMDSGFYRTEKRWKWFSPTNGHQNHSAKISPQSEINNTVNQVESKQNFLTEKRIISWNERLNTIKRSYPRAYNSWTKKEEEELERLFKENIPCSEMAKKLGRQPSAIRSRLKRLGLTKTILLITVMIY